MKVIETKIHGVLIIETDAFVDHRGYFTETYNKPKYETLGITIEFVQNNMNFSVQKGTIRGFHRQNPPYTQAKLVSCTDGKVIDVAVDWGILLNGIELVLSEKDKIGPALENSDNQFFYNENC